MATLKENSFTQTSLICVNVVTVVTTCPENQRFPVASWYELAPLLLNPPQRLPTVTASQSEDDPPRWEYISYRRLLATDSYRPVNITK